MEKVMKEQSAVVIGGSNGIGLAIAKQLIKEDYHVHILDISPPAENVLDATK